MTEKLRIGRMSYTNIYPIFHELDSTLDPDSFELFNSYPSELNRMMRQGVMDVSPSSSIEYLRGDTIYDLIEGHSISARGRVGSVLLYSRVPIEALGDRDIYATHQSETSVALLRIILGEFLGIAAEVQVTTSPFDEAVSSHAAYLSIGDEALAAVRDSRWIDMPGASYRIATVHKQAFYVYDLGELWYKFTGKPFVYALWIARKGLTPHKSSLLDLFRRLLDRTHDSLSERFGAIAHGEGLVLPPQDLVHYWETLDYGLGAENLQGLALFRQYLIKLKLI